MEVYKDNQSTPAYSQINSNQTISQKISFRSYKKTKLAKSDYQEKFIVFRYKDEILFCME